MALFESNQLTTADGGINSKEIILFRWVGAIIFDKNSSISSFVFPFEERVLILKFHIKMKTATLNAFSLFSRERHYVIEELKLLPVGCLCISLFGEGKHVGNMHFKGRGSPRYYSSRINILTRIAVHYQFITPL